MDYEIDTHKIQYHPQRVAKWLEGEAIFPLYVEVSPVGFCNHRCTFCAVDYIGYKSRTIKTATLIDLLCSMNREGVKSVMFAGEGEPLLHKELGRIIHTCGTFIDISITTNGVLLTKDFVDSCLNRIKWVKVSCNAGTPRTYSQIHKTKPTDFSKVWDNLRYAVSQRRHVPTTIGIQSVLLPENAHEMETLAILAKKTGVDYLVIKPYSQHLKSLNKREETYDPTPPQWTKDLTDDKFQVIWRSNAMESAQNEDRGYTTCYATPHFWAYVMATGDVYGCSAYLEDERFCYGNINEASFSDIWQGEKRKESIRFVEEELDIKECRVNCRMNSVNKYLNRLKNPHIHESFI